MALLRRGGERVAHWRVGHDGPVPLGLDLDGLVRHADALADRVERGGPETADPADLRPRLRP